MKNLLFILVLVNFFSVDILSQSIPKQINYQGLLKDAAGNNVSDGTYSMVFSIYNEPTGGTALWSETQDVAVSGGLFFVRLGSVTPITTVPFDRQHYLGIAVNSGDELTPRTYLSPSPYSFMSMNVVDNSITTSKIQDGAVTKAKLGSDVSLGTSGAAGGDLKGNYPNPIVQKLQGKSISETAPSVDQVLKWDGTEWKPSADATATGTAGGDITKVTAGNGLTGGGDANDVTLNVGAGNGITVSADAVALNTTYSDGRYVNEGQANSVTANMITPNIVSSVDGVSNDGGNIDLVAGSNVTITPNNTAKTITISAGNGGTTGDNLGNHTATQNIKLNNHWLSGDGGNEGVYVNSSGDVGIGTSSPQSKLGINGNLSLSGTNPYILFGDNGIIKSLDDNHYIKFDRINNQLMLNDWGSILFSTSEQKIGRMLITSSGNVVIGSDGSAGDLILSSQNATNEGGQMILHGAASYDDWTQDSYQNDMRFFTNSANTNTVEISNIGSGKADLEVENEIRSQRTGDANMVPIAYANVNANGILNSAASTSNVTLYSHSTGSGYYYFNISGENINFTTYVCIATINGGIGEISWNSASSKYLNIHTANSAGTSEDKAFTFVLYKK